MSPEEFHKTAVPKPNVLTRLEKDLKKLGKLDEPIFLCFSCDPYPSGCDTSITREAIKLIKASGNNVRILSKSGLFADRDFDLLDSGDEYGVTLAAYHTSIWEPNTAPTHERLISILQAKEWGIRTWVSFEPVIEPDWTLELIGAAAETGCDIIKIGKLNYHPHAKTIDWAKFAQEAKDMCESLGVNYVLKADLAAYLHCPMDCSNCVRNASCEDLREAAEVGR